MNEQETAANLFRLINESAGAAYLNRIHQLGFSQNVFRMNALELLDAVQRVKDPDQGLPLMMERHSEAGRQSHREVNRRVHNFVSSALTLVEHTRIFMRTHYAGTELLATYEKQVTAVFTQSPVAQFVQGLRNYILHRGLPNSSMFMSFRANPGATDGSGIVETGVHYHKASLLDWDEWKPMARSYLECAEEHLDILEFAQEYREIVDKFHVWLGDALAAHHQEHLQELGRLQARYQTVSPMPPAVPITQAGTADSEFAEPFQFTSEQTIKLDQISSELLEKIREICVRTAPQGFVTEIPTIKITEKEIIGSITGWVQEADGASAFVFIRFEDKSYGFSRSDYDGLDGIIDVVMKSNNWARSSLSREFVETAFCDWGRQRFKKDGISFSSALSSAAKKAVAKVEIWAPIAHTVIERSFEFGPVRIETISAKVIDKFRSCGPEVQQEQNQQVDQLFEKLRREVQGYAAVVVPVEAEPTLAGRRGLQIAQDAVGLLRFFSPAAPASFLLNPVVLKGEDCIPQSKLIVLGADSVTISESLLVKEVGFWHLPDQRITELMSGLEAAASLVLTEGLSEFALAVRASLLTYGKGTTLANPLDRLQSALTAVEGILLKHDMEARAHNVANRVSLLLARGEADRQAVKQKVQRIYWLREQPQLSAQGRRVDELFADFTAFAYNVLHIALQNKSAFTSKSEFVTGVDQIDRSLH